MIRPCGRRRSAGPTTTHEEILVAHTRAFSNSAVPEASLGAWATLVEGQPAMKRAHIATLLSAYIGSDGEFVGINGG